MKRASQKKIPPEEFAAAVASRDFDRLVKLVRPYVAKARGVKPIGERPLTGAEKSQRYRDRLKGLSPQQIAEVVAEDAAEADTQSQIDSMTRLAHDVWMESNVE